MRGLIATWMLLLVAASSPVWALPPLQNPAQAGPANAPDEPEKAEFEKAIAAGRASAQRGLFTEAVKHFERAAAIKKGDCSQCFHMVSQSYLQMARFKDAADAARKALALKPADEADLENLLGVELYLQGDEASLADASVAFNRALELANGRLPEIYFNLGYTLIKQGKVADGVSALKEYLKAAPDGGNTYEARAVIANPKLAGERLARDFKVTTLDGKELSLESLKGKVVLLEKCPRFARYGKNTAAIASH